jgi:hypothetical protein
MKNLAWLLLSLLVSSNALAGVVVTGASPSISAVIVYKNQFQSNVATATIIGSTVYYTNMEFDDSAALTNTISVNPYGNDITIASGKTVTGTTNLFGDSAKSGTGTYTPVGVERWSTDPLFISTTTPDFHLRADSPATAGGTNLGAGYTDFASIVLPTPHGWPIGAYGCSLGRLNAILQ